MKKVFLLLFLFFISATITIACSSNSQQQATKQDSERILNVYNWTSYVNPEVIAQFEQDFDVKVNYTTYESMEELYNNVKKDGSRYDVIFPADYSISKSVLTGLFAPLDLEKIPNMANIAPDFLYTPADPKNQYTLPYQWGTIGIGYNLQKTQERIDSWNALFNKKYQGKIYLIDEMRSIFAITLIHLGLDPNTTNTKDIDRAKQYLIEHKDQFALVDGDGGQIFLDEEKVDIAVEYNGDISQIMTENGAIEYAHPQEGSIIWIDFMAIPKASPHKEIAQQFINYILEPKNAAKISNFTRYATPNQKALEKNLIQEEDRKNFAIYPSQEIIERSVFLKNIDDNLTQYYQTAWQEFKDAFKA